MTARTPRPRHPGVTRGGAADPAGPPSRSPPDRLFPSQPSAQLPGLQTLQGPPTLAVLQPPPHISLPSWDTGVQALSSPGVPCDRAGQHQRVSFPHHGLGGMDPGCGGVCGRKSQGRAVSRPSRGPSSHSRPCTPVSRALTLHVQHVLRLLAVARGQRLVLRLADDDAAVVLAVHAKAYRACHTPHLAVLLAAAHSCPARTGSGRDCRLSTPATSPHVSAQITKPRPPIATPPHTSACGWTSPASLRHRHAPSRLRAPRGWSLHQAPPTSGVATPPHTFER